MEIIVNDHPGILGFILAGISFISSMITASIPYLQFILILLGIVSAILAIKRELKNSKELEKKKK